MNHETTEKDQLASWVQEARNRIRAAAPTIAERKHWLCDLSEKIKEHEADLFDALKADLGRCKAESYFTEIATSLRELRYAKRNLKHWARPRRGGFSLMHFGSKARIIPEPRGVVLIMSPWNYPINLSIIPLIAAIAAGNSVVLSLSPHAQASGRAVTNLIQDALPKDLFMVADPKVSSSSDLLEIEYDYIFYTGGEKYAREVMQAAARHLTPVLLELGGKSPAIVGQEADIRLASRRIAWAKTINAGQTCVAPDYLLVHRSREQELLDTIALEWRKFYGEDPIQSPDYARMLTAEAAYRQEELMKGGKIHFGGEVDRARKYVAPTLLTDVGQKQQVMNEEIFGPVLPVIPFDDIEQVITRLNRSPRSLALYYFGSHRQFKRIVQGASAASGSVVHNDTVMQLTHLGLPFGGVGRSGIGAYHGRAGFDALSHHRSSLASSRYVDPSLRYPPYMPLERLKKFLNFL